MIWKLSSTSKNNGRRTNLPHTRRSHHQNILTWNEKIQQPSPYAIWTNRRQQLRQSSSVSLCMRYDQMLNRVIGWTLNEGWQAGNDRYTLWVKILEKVRSTKAEICCIVWLTGSTHRSRILSLSPWERWKAQLKLCPRGHGDVRYFWHVTWPIVFWEEDQNSDFQFVLFFSSFSFLKNSIRIRYLAFRRRWTW